MPNSKPPTKAAAVPATTADTSVPLPATTALIRSNAQKEPVAVLHHDVHCVLRVIAHVKEPIISNSQGTADSTVENQASSDGTLPSSESAAVVLDPATLSLQLKFTPWTGPEVVVSPSPLAEQSSQGQSVEQPSSTASTTQYNGKGELADVATTVSDCTKIQQVASTSTSRAWCAEKHFKLSVNEALVRSMADTHGVLMLPISLAQPPPPPPPKPAKGQPPSPEVDAVSFSALLPLQCAGLLVGDKSVEASWPAKLQSLPEELSSICTSIKISLQVLSMPEPGPEEAAAAAAAAVAAKGAKPVGKQNAAAGKAGKAGAKDVPVEPDLSLLPGQPCNLLPPDLASKLNPLVIMPLRANGLPDAPATCQLLEQKCHPVQLRLQSPFTTSTLASNVVHEQAGRVGPWQQLQAPSSSGPGLHCRAVGFGQPLLLMAGDMQVDETLRACREVPLVLEVHDRTVIPELPEFPITQAGEGTDAAQLEQEEDNSYVCGIVRVSLLDLARGRTSMRFTAPLAPHTTIRGAASLDWGRRPGCYAASQAVMKGWIRCAVPFNSMAGVPMQLRVLTRAAFVMDYRDSELFHLLEDTIRQQNAWSLGLSMPVPKEASTSDLQPATEAATDQGPSAHGRDRLERDKDSSSRNSRCSTPHSHAAEDLKSISMFRPGHGGHRGLTSHSGSTAARLPSMSGTRDLSRGRLRMSEADVAAAAAAEVHPPHLSGTGAPPGSTPAIGTGARVVLWSATQQSNNRDRKELRFHDFGGGVDDSEASDPDSDESEEQSAAQAALDAAVMELETIKLDNRLLQSLSTYKLTPEQSADPQLDILTGWHLVDGKERIIVVEGRAEGAMKVIQAINAWALEDVSPEDGRRKRGVLYNTALRYSTRLWAELGVDLHILKLHAPLHKIVADAASYATGKVRVECIAGLRRLAGLRTAPWARLADELCLFPTPHQVHLVDKKFGGELTKTDVFGIEADEFDSEDEDVDGGGMGLLHDDDMRSSHSSSKRSGRSSRSRRSGKTRKSGKSKRNNCLKHVRKRPLLQPLDRHNEAYIAMREEARARRIAIDWHARNLARLASIEDTSASIRKDWATWNPQREAAKKLEESVRQGAITLEETIQAARLQSRACASAVLRPGEARPKGWVAHPAPFKWPAPPEPGSYAAHPHAPSQLRIEQLAEPWDEEASAAGTMVAGLKQAAGCVGPNFRTTVKNKTGLFGQDPEFWKTVHLGGVGRAAEEAQLKAEEKALWTRKLLVDDPVMHTTLPVRSAPAQTDRVKHILYDQPKKKGFVMAYVPPAPYSMHLSEPWTEKPINAGLRGREKPADFLHPHKDFKRLLHSPDRAMLSKPGPGHMNSWTAAVHDKYYLE